MLIAPDPHSPDDPSAQANGWLILGESGRSFALRSDRVTCVFRTREAVHVEVSEPAAHLQIHGGRPWFVVSADQLFATLGPGLHGAPAEWTVCLRDAQGVAFEVSSIEGPYKGAVIDHELHARQGRWPVMTPRVLQEA